MASCWLDAPPDVLRRRVRAHHGDASDATEPVLEGQLRDESGEIAWQRIDASGDLDDVVRRAIAALDIG